jgi:hypothetical protein
VDAVIASRDFPHAEVAKQMHRLMVMPSAGKDGRAIRALRQVQ